MYEIYSGRGNDVSYTEGRSIALALSTLLLFSMVIAVDVRMSVTNGKHSFGVAAAIPWIVATVISFSESTRTTTIAPSMIYYLICYLKGYRFRKLHYIALVLGMVVFVYIIGPLEVFSREVLSGKTLEDRVMMSFQLLATYHDPGELRDSAMQVFESAAAREQYFSRPGTYIISRLSLIRADSNIVSACSGGFHYGFEGIRIDLLQSIPTFLYKAKPRYTNGQDYIGHVIGMSSDAETNSYPQESAVGDSYGAFGWAGVILFPLFCFPCVFIVYESIFNIDRPWGIVAFGSCLLTFGELMVGRFVPLVVRTPIYLIALSYVIGTVANMIPVRGDRPRTLWRSNRTCQQDESASH